MPQSYDYEDHRIELEAELASLRDDLTAEVKAHKRTAESRDWYKHRVDMLQRKQTRMREPERTLVCDIIANCALLPDPNGERYGKQNVKAHRPSEPEANEGSVCRLVR